MSSAQLHWADWLVFALTLVISLAIGVYFALAGDRQRTTKEYLVANRKLAIVPAAFSILMSYLSAGFVIGQTAEIYLHGTQIIVGLPGILAGYVICALVIVPTFHKLKLVSAYEYLILRFQSKWLQLICVLLQLLTMAMAMGFAMYSPSISLETVTGFPTWGSILIIGGVAIFYTMIGGLKAVVWTDTFQGLVLFTGLIAVSVLGTNKVGGLSRVWEISKEGGRHNWLEFNPDPTLRMNFWGLIFGQMVYSIVAVGTSQYNVQRYCSLPTLTKARLSIVSLGLLYVIAVLLVSLCGMVVFSYYHSLGCDPLRGRLIWSANQILPYFVVNILNYPGLPGLFFAVLFAGALSTLSSAVNGMSAITWKDILEPSFSKLKENRKALVTKLLVLVYGCIGTVLALIVHFFPGHILQATVRILNGISGPISGVMLLGILFPFANALGSGTGAIISFAICTWINIGATLNPYHLYTLPTRVDNCTFQENVTALPNPTNPPPESVFPLYRLSFLLIGTLAMVTTTLIGIIVSILSGGEKPERRNPKYIIPLNRYLCCCLPQPMQKFLSCGLDHYSQSDGEAEKDDNQTAVNREERPGNATVNHVQLQDVQNPVRPKPLANFKVFKRNDSLDNTKKVDGITLCSFSKLSI